MTHHRLTTVLDNVAGSAAIAGTILLSPLLRPWYSRWGATAAEAARSLPGDDLVPQPRLETTRALTVRAPASTLWAWLVQIGHGRGGLYSYDGLENLIGCDLHSAGHIQPQFQQLAVGDLVRLGPEGYPFFVVHALEPGRALVLRSGTPQGTVPSSLSSWVFLLDETAAHATRLIVRTRLDYPPTLHNRFHWRVLTDPMSFVMERKMMLGLQARAEGRL